MDPSSDDQPMYPSQELLEMERKANEVFKRYAKLYYDMNFLTSVYFFDAENNGFGSCWLIKKSKFSHFVFIFLNFLQQTQMNVVWIMAIGMRYIW